MQSAAHPAQAPILAISGSLRRNSINSAALRAAATAAAPDGLTVVIDDSPRALPPFDPDLEPSPPDVVRRFRRACVNTTAVLVAVPEYTFGIPGTFKNALDWTVGSGSLYRKPMALLHVAPPGRGAHVREALDHVLRAHNAEVTHHHVPIAPRDRDADGEISDTHIIEALRTVVAELAQRASAGRAA
jgi:chromate reductase, NAD(P)H dehydrogenase (quinone)